MRRLRHTLALLLAPWLYGGWEHGKRWREYAQKWELDRLRYQAALELVAAPKRADGTYNRSREACEALAREALASEGKATCECPEPRRSAAGHVCIAGDC